MKSYLFSRGKLFLYIIYAAKLDSIPSYTTTYVVLLIHEYVKSYNILKV